MTERDDRDRVERVARALIETYDLFVDWRTMARAAIAAAEPQWQPISEKPAEDTSADLWCSSQYWTGRRADCWFENGKWWRLSYRDGDPVEVDDATHWMPLPPPPGDKP